MRHKARRKRGLSVWPPYTIQAKKEPGSRFNIKMSSYRYRKSHCGDKTIVRSSYLHNGISYTDKTVSSYWMRALGPLVNITLMPHVLCPKPTAIERSCLLHQDCGINYQKISRVTNPLKFSITTSRLTYVCKLLLTLHVDFDMSEEEWADVFLGPYICLRETKLQSFQYEIINRIINCNKKLFDIKIKKTPLYVHTVIKQMISIISSSCVKMCMNSGKGYVPGGIHLIMTMLIFQRSQMWKLSSSGHNVSLKLWLYWTFVCFIWNIIFIDSDCFRIMCSTSMKSKIRYSQNWKSNRTYVKKKIKTTNLINFKYFMKTWNDKALIWKLIYPPWKA